MKFRSKNGFTLIEIIISLAIIGIISVSFLTLFSSGFKYIVNSGHRSIDNFTTQAKVENALNTTPSSNSGIVINLPDSTTITAEGEVSSSSTGSVNITYFKPKY